MRDVIDRDRDAVLLAPILGEAIEPSVILRDEMTPLQDSKRFGLGESSRYEWRRNCGCQAGSPGSDARCLEEVSSCNGTFLVISSRFHRCPPYRCDFVTNVGDALLGVSKPAGSATSLNRWHRAAPSQSPSMVSQAPGEACRPRPAVATGLNRQNGYPFGNRIITMHIYHGNPQNVTSW